MKQLIQITALVLGVSIIAIAIVLYPIFSNMKSEYETAEAIHDIAVYVRENQGRWPSSPEQLQNKYPVGGDVEIDYSITVGELIDNPEKLRNAVRPRSGKFYTYPHYNKKIEDLLLNLQSSFAPSALAEESLTISYATPADKVEYGKLYFYVYRKKDNIFLQLINAYGENLFLKKEKPGFYFSTSVQTANWEVVSSSGFGMSSGNGPQDYIKLAYDSHDDGSVCGWQITPCGNKKISYKSLEDVIKIEGRMQIFFSDIDKHKSIKFRYESKLKEIQNFESDS